MRISDWSSDVCSSDLPDVQQVKLFRLQCLYSRHRHQGDFGHDRSRRRGQFQQYRDDPEPLLRTRVLRHGAAGGAAWAAGHPLRSEEHTSELQSLMRISYAVFCLQKKKKETEETNVTT